MQTIGYRQWDKLRTFYVSALPSKELGCADWGYTDRIQGHNGWKLMYPQPEPKSEWGRWKLNITTLVLTHDEYGYEIDLESITSSAQMLDWIFQLRGKTWHTDEDLGNLIKAFRDIFDPQHNMCSFGQERSKPKKLQKTLKDYCRKVA